MDHLKLYEGVHPVKSWVTAKIPVELRGGGGGGGGGGGVIPSRRCMSKREQPIFENRAWFWVLSWRSSRYFGTTRRPKITRWSQSFKWGFLWVESLSNSLNFSGPDLLPLDRNLCSRCSSWPCKPKIQADYLYHYIGLKSVNEVMGCNALFSKVHL